MRKKGGECYQSKAGLVRSKLANQSRRETEHKVALLKKRGAEKAQVHRAGFFFSRKNALKKFNQKIEHNINSFAGYKFTN